MIDRIAHLGDAGAGESLELRRHDCCFENTSTYANAVQLRSDQCLCS